jgi:hypothetical protein
MRARLRRLTMATGPAGVDQSSSSSETESDETDHYIDEKRLTLLALEAALTFS